MSEEIRQGHEAATSMLDNWPWLIAVLSPVAELYRRIFKAATKEELQKACEKTEDRFNRIHSELREDIQAVGRQVDDLKIHLLRRREDRE